MKYLEIFLRQAEYMVRFLSIFGTISICPIFIIMIGDVIGRTFFNFTIRGSIEINEYLMVVLAFAGLGHAQLSGRHVTANFLVRHFSVNLQKYLQIIVLSLAASLYIIMSWQIGKVTYKAWIEKSTHWAVDYNLPTWPPYLFALLGCIALFLTFIIQIIRNIVYLTNAENL